MNTHTRISGTTAHRLIIHFLLNEALTQYFLVNKSETLEEQLLKIIIEQNTAALGAEIDKKIFLTHWWRMCMRSIEDAGLNHFVVAKVLSNAE